MLRRPERCVLTRDDKPLIKNTIPSLQALYDFLIKYTPNRKRINVNNENYMGVCNEIRVMINEFGVDEFSLLLESMSGEGEGDGLKYFERGNIEYLRVISDAIVYDRENKGEKIIKKIVSSNTFKVYYYSKFLYELSKRDVLITKHDLNFIRTITNITWGIKDCDIILLSTSHTQENTKLYNRNIDLLSLHHSQIDDCFNYIFSSGEIIFSNFDPDDFKYTLKDKSKLYQLFKNINKSINSSQLLSNDEKAIISHDVLKKVYDWNTQHPHQKFEILNNLYNIINNSEWGKNNYLVIESGDVGMEQIQRERGMEIEIESEGEEYYIECPKPTFDDGGDLIGNTWDKRYIPHFLKNNIDTISHLYEGCEEGSYTMGVQQNIRIIAWLSYIIKYHISSSLFCIPDYKYYLEDLEGTIEIDESRIEDKNLFTVVFKLEGETNKYFDELKSIYQYTYTHQFYDDDGNFLDVKNYIVKYMIKDSIIKIIKECDRDYILLYLSIYGFTLDSWEGHANSVIINNTHKQLLRFEPGGVRDIFDTLLDKFMIYITKNLEISVQSRKETIMDIDEYTYINIQDKCPNISIQAKSEIGRVGIIGFCVTWSLIYLHYYLLNPNIQFDQLYDKIIKDDPDKLFSISKKYTHLMETIIPVYDTLDAWKKWFEYMEINN